MRGWLLKLALGAAVYALAAYVIVTKPDQPSCPTPAHVEEHRS